MRIMRHFAIGWALFRYYWRLVPHDWIRRRPFLPVPPSNYLQWRMRTAYGAHRPSWPQVIRDVWIFADSVRRFDLGKKAPETGSD
jgi:hypothetical protein